MANSKISALTALTGANVDTAADLLAIVDTSASTDKKILVDELRNALGPVSATKTATTSGTSVDYTSIPSWVKKITVMLNGVSTNGTSPIIIQIGDSGGIETSGYLGAAVDVGTSASSGANYTTGFGIEAASASGTTRHGAYTISLEDSSGFTWVCSGAMGRSDFAVASYSGGSKSTSAALDRIRITTVGGTDTFDAGSVNVLYE